MKHIAFILLVFLVCPLSLYAQQQDNKPATVERFMDMGFGMFIHWSMDSQLGAVISHSMAGASDDYLERFTSELPKTFNPVRFAPREWAVLAKLAGMKYVVFTAKHHSGFCMFETQSTPFNIMNTPFGRDATREILDAFRAEGIATGLYFSPEDFYYCYKNNIPIGRLQHPMHYPENNPGLMDYDKKQLRELLTNYGKIDVIFFDGPAEGLKELAWELQPDIMVTRGHIETPEQETPDRSIPGPWEACYTMGTDWQYKPTNDPHKTGTEIIDMLIEIRAKGGNFLLNIGPKPDGEIQIEQEALLREVALWNFVNNEAICGIRPWNVIREKNIWYTSSADKKTVYAFVTGSDWLYGERKDFLLRRVKGDAKTIVSVLGYASGLVEYREGFDASIRWEQTSEGLLISAVNGHRLYTNNKWPNPVVLKIENALPVDDTSSNAIKKSTIDGAQ
ncbi:MAG: alpha-L-fucosidase [Tannerella sp.]|jgi:alpha-L-fucosidase|nr:alpha-L-fucosidase [Tannerella sp.]